jgi:hypothetical protein
MEFFGGTVRFKHYIATGADDDSLDIDTGLQGNFQYVLLLQRSGGGDAMVEADSNGLETDTPRQKTTIANFTMVQPAVSSNNEANDLASLLIRGNADITLVNGVINTPNNECLRLNGSGTVPATLKAYSVVMSCNSTKYLGSGSYTAADTQSQFQAGTNNNDAFTSTLTSTFVNGANESGVTAYASLTTLSSFFTAATYIGAVKDASDTWYKGWTCNNATGAFGSTYSCTGLPTT